MIAREGWPFVGGASALAAVVIVLAGLWGLPVLILPAFILYFFRDPERTAPNDPRAIVSPADGKVVEIRDLQEDRYLHAPVRRISIFLSIFNVHITRVPYSGVVRGLHYRPGKFLIAFHEKASEENEQNAVVLETAGSGKLMFVQIAGLIARRIVCRIREGEQALKGERYGLIRFGSRMDVYLPLSYAITVRKGDRVKGGETVIGRTP